MMSKSTIAWITAITLIVFHGAGLLFGWRGVVALLVAVAAFVLIGRALYWRQLRKLRQTTRWMSDADRKLVYSLARFDVEARHDMEGLEKEERRDLHEDHNVR